MKSFREFWLFFVEFEKVSFYSIRRERGIRTVNPTTPLYSAIHNIYTSFKI